MTRPVLPSRKENPSFFQLAFALLVLGAAIAAVVLVWFAVLWALPAAVIALVWNWFAAPDQQMTFWMALVIVLLIRILRFLLFGRGNS